MLVTASLAQPDSYTAGGGGRESGKVPYIELSRPFTVGYATANYVANAIKMQSDWSRLVPGGWDNSMYGTLPDSHPPPPEV